MTTLPRTAPDSSRATASAARSSGNTSIDDRPHLARVDATGELGEVVAAAPGGERAQVLRHERRRDGCRGHAAERTEHPPAPPRREDERAPAGERPAHAPERMVGDEVEHDVVAALVRREVLGLVVDHVVGADRAHVVGLRGAAHAGHLGAHGLRELHREAADAAGRAVDEQVRPGPELDEPQPLQRRRARDHHGCGVHGVDRGRPRRDEPLGHGDELGEAALVGLGVHRVADPIPRDGRADGRDLARDIPPDHRLARAAQAERETTDAGLAAHDEDVAHADGHGGHPDEHLVVRGHRRVDLGEREHLGPAVAAAHDRPHDAAPVGRSAGDIATTTLPALCPPSTRRCASTMSSNGTTRSITGTIAPDSRRSTRSGSSPALSASGRSPVNAIAARRPRLEQLRDGAPAAGSRPSARREVDAVLA